MLDNVLYQREDHLASCEFLGIRNPEIPRMPSVQASIQLKFWQPVAIAALVKSEQPQNIRGAAADENPLPTHWCTFEKSIILSGLLY